MKIVKGIYEQVISEALGKELENNIKDLEVYKEVIDHTDASAILSTYLGYVVKKGLNYYKSSKEDVLKQIEIINKIIEQFSEAIEDEEFLEYKINENNILKGVFEKEALKRQQQVYPITSIAKSSLFTGATTEPAVYSELNKEIATADRIDLLVSFIKFSGLRLLMDSLIQHTKTKKLRIVTTSYMGASDYKAIKMLSDLPNTEVKISYDTKRTRLHAKAYYFHRDTGFSTAYIGSSNMSKAALTEGTEWNMKISEYTSKEVMEKYRITFETYWNASEFSKFNSSNREDLRQLKQSLKRESTNNGITFNFDIKPYPYQKEILEALKVERELFKSRRNLVVAATGTGKTVVSAFDFLRYYKENPNCKLLFLAHRKEILEQSIATFRGILREQNFGQLWVGEHTPASYDHVFASIQTISRNAKYLQFEAKEFDYIVLDETHHGAAESYENIISHFDPDILLGLTATPERMDGMDILKYFNHRIAYEIRLHQAIERSLLCPFHYFGITDSVDVSTVKWTRGRYDSNELGNVYTGNDIRADLIIRSIDKYINNIEDIKGIGFCVNKAHAKYMADYFNKSNIPSINLDSDSPQELRSNARHQLNKGDIKFIFVVDLYNEGVDIPQINTVLFLRPTESATIFIQQLGRGLRMCEDKEVLTVLDFIGQANKQFDYRTKLRSIVGKTSNALKSEISNGFPTLPKGCFVQLEKRAEEIILDNLKLTYATKNNLRRMIRTYGYETDEPLSLSSFLRHYQIEPWYIYKSTSFYELCYLEGVKDNYKCKHNRELKTALKKVMSINSHKLISFLLEYLNRDEYTLNNLNEEEKQMLLMFHYTVWKECPGGDLLKYLKKLRHDNSSIFNEIIELLRFNKEHIDFIEKDVALDYECPLELHAKYSIDQVLSAMGEHTVYKKKSFREGVLYMKDKETDIFFITLNKSDKEFTTTTQYEDYAISEKLFHWQTQSRTSIQSPTGQRYITQRDHKGKVLLFVREYKNENTITSPFYFLGKANYVSHEGSKPISIVFELEEPIPSRILKKSNKVADVI